MSKVLGVLVACVMALVAAGPATAQESDLNMQIYQSESNREGVMIVYALNTEFASDEEAEEFMERADLADLNQSLIDETFTGAVIDEDDDFRVRVGDQAEGYEAVFTFRGERVESAYIMVREGETIYIYVGLGYAETTDDLTDIVTEYHEDDPEGELLDLTDLPDGFTLVEQEEENVG